MVVDSDSRHYVRNPVSAEGAVTHIQFPVMRPVDPWTFLLDDERWRGDVQLSLVPSESIA